MKESLTKAIVMMDYAKIGKKVRFARKMARLTQAELSKRVGASTAFISYLEKGRLKNPHKRLDIIAEALNIPVDDLFK
jgi:transcriptional regulator with XRE-family HTH domain